VWESCHKLIRAVIENLCPAYEASNWDASLVQCIGKRHRRSIVVRVTIHINVLRNVPA
jgi:hypothetical protein